MKKKAVIYLSKCTSSEPIDSQKAKCLKYADENGFVVHPKKDVYVTECGANESECGYAEMAAFKKVVGGLSNEPAGSLTLIVYNTHSLNDSHLFQDIANSVKGPLPILIYQDKN